MNQCLRERGRAEQVLSKTMMQRDRAVLRLRRVQRDRQDDQFILGNRRAQLQHERDEAVKARDRAEGREDLAVRKMTEALQERDEALQRKDEVLQQEQQGRLEDQAKWNSHHARLVEETDQAL